MELLRREKVDLKKIKPDPRQPRKYFDPEVIKAMAATMLSNLKEGKTGIINDIELDEHYIIITGEQRWQAGILANLPPVDCKIYKVPPPEERFFRQGIENLSRGSMAAMETSNWLVGVLKSIGWKPPEPGSRGRTAEGRFTGDGHVAILAKKIGKSARWLEQMLVLQDEKEEVKKYLNSPEAKYSLIREINQSAPTEHKDALKEKVLKGTLKDRETTNELIRALNGYDEKVQWPKQVKDRLLKEEYTAPRSTQNIKKIDEIAPEPKTNQRDSDLGEDMAKHLNGLYMILGRVDLNQIGGTRKDGIIKSCESLIERLGAIVSTLKGNVLEGGEENE